MTAEVAPLRWDDAQKALRDMVSRLTTMMRTIPDVTTASVGQWSMAEVAMHLSQVWVVVPGLARDDLSDLYAVTPSLEGRAGSSLMDDVWELGEVTRLGVMSDPERDLGVLADRIDERAAAFFAESAGKSAEERRPWLVEGTTVPRWLLTCHLLNETIVHGYDIAKAAGKAWRIERRYAAMALRGFVVEIINTIDPHAMVNQEKAAGLHARYDIRMRGADRFTYVFDGGALHIEGPSTSRVDCHISADPATMLLIAWGRRSQWTAIARGQVTAWGRKPWLGPRFRSLIRNP